jgi:hypothetical protein
MPDKFPRGQCSVCHREVAVLRDGSAHEHYAPADSPAPQSATTKVCSGSGKQAQRR